jgi:hypothetical protein
MVKNEWVDEGCADYSLCLVFVVNIFHCMLGVCITNGSGLDSYVTRRNEGVVYGRWNLSSLCKLRPQFGSFHFRKPENLPI